MKRILLIIVFLVFYFYSSNAQIRTTEQGPLSDLLIENNSDYYFQYRATRQLNWNDFQARYFIYRSKDDRHLIGSGFEITKPDKKEPLWYKLVRGDYGLHSLATVDLNHDEKPDLFHYSGFEDVFSSHIYLANYEDVKIDAFSEDHFTKIYSKKNDYSVLIDPDHDRHPEILDSGHSGSVNKSGFNCTGDPSGITIDQDNRVTLSETVRQKIVTKYFETVGDFDAYNFDYSMPESYPLFNSFILSPIKIYRIEGQKLVNVTSSFPKYLNWRIRILNKIKKESSEKCRKQINNIIEYLENKLDG